MAGAAATFGLSLAAAWIGLGRAPIWLVGLALLAGGLAGRR